VPQEFTELRRARGKIQEAYSKIIGKFGRTSDILDLLTEALALLKSVDVPGGVREVEEAAAAAPPEPVTIEDHIGSLTAEPPPNKTPRKRSMGRSK
jgi:hypothetical protein